MVRSVGDGVELALRALALPGFFGLRWLAGQRGLPDEIPAAGRGAALAAKIALDEFFLATEVLSLQLVALREHRRIVGEMRAALRLYQRRGWIRQPARFHRAPSPLVPAWLGERRSGGIDYAHLSFASAYAPHPGEPGRARWRSYEANRTAHAWLVRHPGRDRPWVVCVPGFRMGRPRVDFTGFRVGWLHHELGLNVAIPVLPFHGPRSTGRRGGDGFLSGDFLDTIHAQSQAVSDVRQLVRWLRRERAPSIALYGLSLGGYTTALVAALEHDLDCVVAGIPAACFVGLARWNAPSLLLRLAERAGFVWEELEKLLRVVSPLALPPRVPRGRRYLFAGTADRLAPPAQAHQLWHHWERPRLAWYRGSHVSFCFEPAVPALLREAFQASGLLGPPARRRSRRSDRPRRSTSARPAAVC